MQSSRRSSKDKGRKKFPTAWSKWEWTADYNCDFRWRLTGEGQDDVEYDYSNDGNTAQDQAVDPAYVPADDQTRSEIYGSTPNESNYTFSAEQITEDFSGLSVNPGGQTVTPAATADTYRAPYTPAPNYSTASYPSRGAGGSSSNYNTGTTASNTAFATPHAANQRYIHTKNPGSSVDLDPNYKLHQSKDFTFGRIFKVLWSEPTGSGGTEVTRPKGIRKAKFGESAYDSVRRFVIIREGNGHCICLPILTYGGQGTRKKGVHAEDHAVIYTEPSPIFKDGEQITKKSIRMVPDSSRHKLDTASRINYAKVYTVEHNVKVYFVGRITRKHEQQVVTDYNNTHQPLPDRPYYAATGEDTYGHAQGGDSEYSYPLRHEYDPAVGPLDIVEEGVEPAVGDDHIHGGMSHDYSHQQDLYDA